MNITHLIILLVRFFAICLAVYSINSFVYNLIIFSGSEDFSITSFIVPGSLILAGFLIWLMPYSLARLLTGYKGNVDSESLPISSGHFENTTFLILALYLSYRVISDGGYWLYYYLNYEKFGLTGIGLDAKASMFATVLEVIFLIAMLLGRKQIFILFKRLRS